MSQQKADDLKVMELQQKLFDMQTVAENEKNKVEEEMEKMQKLLKETENKIKKTEDVRKSTEKTLKAKISMLEDFKREYAAVSEQRANRVEMTLKSEISDLKTKLETSKKENDGLREDYIITSKINENLVTGQWCDCFYTFKNIRSLDNIRGTLFSDVLTPLGKWRLICYRNMNGNLSCLVVMTRGVSGIYEFKIELQHPERPTKNYKMTGKEYFRILWPSNNYDFMNYLKFFQEDFYDKVEDTFTVKFSVRAAPNEFINSFAMVERASSHKIEVKNFQELLDQNIINYCSFYDDHGFCWKLLLKRDVWFEKKGEKFFSASLYLLNGLYDSTYSVSLEILNPDPNKNIKAHEDFTYNSPSEFWDYSSFAQIDKLLKDGFITREGSLEINVTVHMTEPKSQDEYMPALSRNLIDYNFVSFSCKTELAEKLYHAENLTDDMNNKWHVTVKYNDGIFVDNKTVIKKFLMFIVQLQTGEEGEYEFFVELLHQNASKVICRPIRGYWEPKERYEITHFTSIERMKDGGYVNPDNTFTVRYSVRPLRLGL